MPLRSLHRLWEANGVSVSEWIREVRLSRCRRDLGDPALAHGGVGTICRALGDAQRRTFSRLCRAATVLAARAAGD